MGCSLLALLYLQTTYIRQMTKMRKEQFDESVFRSLDQAARNLEQNETFGIWKRFRWSPSFIAVSSILSTICSCCRADRCWIVLQNSILLFR